MLFVITAFILTACSQTYYVVRHAEKAEVGNETPMMSKDPPLSSAGKKRAEALKEVLKNKKIRHIFSTNTLRTIATGEPLRAYLGITVEMYDSPPDAALFAKLKTLPNNTLIVAHSNTVDDIVNGLSDAIKIPGDLKDNEYDNLFVVTRKHLFRTTVVFQRKTYGDISLSSR